MLALCVVVNMVFVLSIVYATFPTRRIIETVGFKKYFPTYLTIVNFINEQ